MLIEKQNIISIYFQRKLLEYFRIFQAPYIYFT